MSDGAAELPGFPAEVEGSDEGESMFRAGPGLWVNGKEILHPDAPGHFDVRLTRRVIREAQGPPGRGRAGASASLGQTFSLTEEDQVCIM